MNTVTVVHRDRVVTVRLNSWVARLLRPGSINNGLTLSSHTIRFARDWYTARGIAHEWGHTMQAEALGWRYLPWVLGTYLTSGYANSDAEREADAYMDAHHTEFTNYGPVPPWVVG